MMATAKKRLLSGSSDGKPIKVAATATAGTAVHTAVAGQTAGTVDEIWLWAQNNHTANVVLTVEFGSSDGEDNIIITIPFKSGLVPIVPGLPLQNSMTVKAFAAVADVVSIHGFVNAITD
jgi:hypothetical protein